ncbi:hypothetical protein V6Z12_D06G143900 [Gossypium hirsutum]
MYVATLGLYGMKPPTIAVPTCIKEDVEKLFELHGKMDQSELKHNLIGLDGLWDVESDNDDQEEGYVLWIISQFYSFYLKCSLQVCHCLRHLAFLLYGGMDDEDNFVAKMKAAEEALEAKQKVTNSLSATCSIFFFIMFYNFVTNCSWYSEDIYEKLPYDSIVFILHGCTMYFLTSLINFMCGV